MVVGGRHEEVSRYRRPMTTIKCVCSCSLEAAAAAFVFIVKRTNGDRRVLMIKRSLDDCGWQRVGGCARSIALHGVG